MARMVAEARSEVARERRRRLTRRGGGAAAVVAVMAVGTAAAAGVLPGTSQRNEPGWAQLTDAAARTVQAFEWTSTHPVDRICVERLSGWGLSDVEVSAIEAKLSDPAALLAKDDGAVRQEFLDRGWANDSPEDTAAMDAAYAEVATLDFAAGRGTLGDDELTGDFLTDRYDEVFLHVYWRLILDGIGAGPHGYHDISPAMESLNPETACVVPE